MNEECVKLTLDNVHLIPMERAALIDGADVYRNPVGSRATSRYFIPCELCGEKIMKFQYSRKRNYVCKYCKDKIKKKGELKKKIEIPEAGETKHEERFRKATERIKEQVNDFSQYENAIRIAKQRCELYGSIPEAMVAIELIRLGYSIIPQQKIKRYKVDFAIPKQKLIVEVDGYLFHKKITEREAIIQFAIGLDWKIIHIPAERIERQIQKLDQVIEALSQ